MSWVPVVSTAVSAYAAYADRVAKRRLAAEELAAERQEATNLGVSVEELRTAAAVRLRMRRADPESDIETGIGKVERGIAMLKALGMVP